MTGQCER